MKNGERARVLQILSEITAKQRSPVFKILLSCKYAPKPGVLLNKLEGN